MNRNFQIKISLDKIRPEIYRTIEIKADIALYQLHHVIQFSFGWENYHLYEFEFNGLSYSNPVLMQGGGAIDDKKVKLSSLLKKPSDAFTYVYDMGDYWVHTIQLKKIVNTISILKKPFCIVGARNCPPEDCGGIDGYKQLVSSMKQKGSIEYEENVEWLGEVYHPEHFNKAEVNDRLKNMLPII